MIDKLKAAAELVIHTYESDPRLLQISLRLTKTAEASLELARAYLAEQAERAKPIANDEETREWLRSVGGIIVDEGGTFQRVVFRDGSIYVHVYLTQPKCWIGRENAVADIEVKPHATRGQLLDLLRGLGIPTKQQRCGV
jgi:hypothetical protein